MTEADLMGQSMDCFTAKLLDKELLAQTTSGGVVTGILLDLLRQGIYDRVSILDGVGTETRAPGLTFTTDRDVILKSARSKYVPVSAFNLVAALEERKDKSTVITATPCVLDGIKRYAYLRGIQLDNVLLIGLFCDMTMSMNFIEYIERRFAYSKEHVASLEYRDKLAGGWPGDMRATFSNGRSVSIKRRKRVELKPYFRLKRCLYCTDKLNRASDISVGDCYVKHLEDKEGKSCVIIRTRKGREAFSACAAQFQLEPLEPAEVSVSQGLIEVRNRAEELGKYIKATGSTEYRGNDPFEYSGFAEDQEHLIEWGRSLRISRIRLDKTMRHSISVMKKAYRYALIAMILLWRILLDATSVLIGGRDNAGNHERIAIVGAGFHNRGAQSMALTVVDCIRRENPDMEIALLVGYYESEKPKWKDFRLDILPWDYTYKLLLIYPKMLRRFLRKALVAGEVPDNLEDYERITRFIDVSGYTLSSGYRWTTSLTYLLNIMVARALGATIEGRAHEAL